MSKVDIRRTILAGNFLDRAIHILMIAVLAWIGLMFALPNSSAHLSVSFAVMHKLAGNAVWVCFFIGSASVGVLGYFLRHVSGFLLGSMALLSSSHLLFALLILCSQPLTTGTAVYSGVAALGVLIIMRASAGIYD